MKGINIFIHPMVMELLVYSDIEHKVQSKGYMLNKSQLYFIKIKSRFRICSELVHFHNLVKLRIIKAPSPLIITYAKLLNGPSGQIYK